MVSEARCSHCGAAAVETAGGRRCSVCDRPFSPGTGANWALGLGLATAAIFVLGPFALWMGLRSRSYGGARSLVGIVLGALGTLVTLAFVGIVLGGAYFYLTGAGDSGWTAGVSALLHREREREVVERVPLSEDQQALIEDYGYPNRFVIAVDEQGTRSEVWDYFICTGQDAFLRENFEPRRLYFEDGVFMASTPIAPSSTGRFPDYRPTEFDMASDEAQIREIMGRPTERRELDMQEYGTVTVLNYRREITFMFREGEALGVMTFVEDGTQGEARP